MFDVTKGKSHYGSEGGYNHFAGRYNLYPILRTEKYMFLCSDIDDRFLVWVGQRYAHYELFILFMLLGILMSSAEVWLSVTALKRDK